MSDDRRRRRDAAIAPPVRAVLDRYPAWAREKLVEMRALILSVAEEDPARPELDECLKWGEPAYVCKESARGTTIRIAWSPRRPADVGLFFSCRTSLADEFTALFPALRFEGHRGVLVGKDEPVPAPELAAIIEAALDYHLRKKQGKQRA